MKKIQNKRKFLYIIPFILAIAAIVILLTALIKNRDGLWITIGLGCNVLAFILLYFLRKADSK